jgi:hypothetical protein
MKYVNIAYDARLAVKEMGPRIAALIIPPPDQSPGQFIVGILDDVDKAWHLCRFVHCITPNEKLEDPNLAYLPEQMQRDIPVFRNRLWGAWRHICCALEVASGAMGGKGEFESNAAGRVMKVFTDGVSDDRIKKAVGVVQGDELTANAKLMAIDKLIRFPPRLPQSNWGKCSA